MEIIPAILTNDLSEFKESLSALFFSKTIQIDFMDGEFVETNSINPSDLILNNNSFFEAHLMVNNPVKYFETLKSKGFQRIILHKESQGFDDALKNAEKFGFEICVAFNPKTKPILIKNITRYLFLTVNPGKQGQKFIKERLKDVLEFKQKNKVVVGVDGGVNLNSLEYLQEVDFICVGSFITKSKNPKEAYEKLVRNGLKKES
jgi:ribulose-phosphate 3-epimerase